jgi:DNA (cytosine-5)-methyltransferase 1
MRVLNLYAGIGGNRKLWSDVDVVAVEIDAQIAEVYRDLFPSDEVVVSDAHQYLLDNYRNFDFIWSSTPCQTHSSFRQNIGVRFRGVQAQYPDMKLYQEILFLQHNFSGLWVVENVIPYYEPLVRPTATLQRHHFWSNFPISVVDFKKDVVRKAQIPDLQEHHGVSLDGYKIPNKRQVLRNCVFPPLGKHVLECARNKNNSTVSYTSLPLFSEVAQ